MASGFSLGAAIGATGKFPKLKPAEVDTAAQDRVAKELMAIKQGITVDKNKYHTVYINQAAADQQQAIDELLNAERNRDPERVSKAYTIDNELQRKRNFLQVLSKDLFDIEEDSQYGDQKGLYVPSYFDELKKVIKTAKTEDQLFQRLQENPNFFKDGYLQISVDENGLRRVIPTLNKKFDFEKEFSGKNIFNLDQQGVLITEDKNFTDKERTIKRFKSIPIDREEALKLKETQPKIIPENNAFDLGKNWFLNNPKAQQQYKSMLYETGRLVDGDPAETNPEELYKKFYSQYVITNIPAQYENKDQVIPRYITNINVSTGQDVAPTNFSIGRFTTNYLGGDELATDLGVAASKEPDGVQVEIPQNAYIISLDTGKPEFRGTATKQMTIARIGVFPATRAKDPESGKIVLVPLTSKQRKEKDDRGEKYLMYPFALAVDKPLEIGVMPDLSKAAYAIPLYEPDANGNFVISTEVRRSKNGKGSPLLNQVISRGKWDDESLANWNVTFFNMMKGVKDQNDLK
jgi:hypothetical protein